VADPGFQVRGGALKKIVGVFRVKNHDFTPKKSHFFQFYPWVFIANYTVHITFSNGVIHTTFLRKTVTPHIKTVLLIEY
jgi:hypothetical protein